MFPSTQQIRSDAGPDRGRLSDGKHRAQGKGAAGRVTLREDTTTI